MSQAGKSPTPKLPPIAAGQRYGRLIALNQVESDGREQWRLRCDCGNEVIKKARYLKTGETKSCGCAKHDNAVTVGLANTTHGMTRAPEWHSWMAMKSRCNNLSDPGFHNYGGRGITVCERWLSFEAFYTDMGSKPSPHHSLDRINNNGNYEPGNVRWATRQEQSRNQRTNYLVNYVGLTMTLAEAAEISGLNQNAVRARIRKGWSAEAALSTPYLRRHRTRPDQSS